MSNLESKAIHDKFKGATSSTPNNLLVQSRKPIHPEAATPSPIGKTTASEENIYVTPNECYESNPRRFNYKRCTESTESEQSSSYINDTSLSNSSNSNWEFSHESDRIVKPPISLVLKNSDRDVEESKQELPKQTIMIGLGVLIAFISGMIFLAFNSEATDLLLNKITIEDLQNNFPLQSEEMWNALQTGIGEVKQLNKPSVFLFLYEEEAENTVNNILYNASTYAECILNENCEIQPIILTSSSLNTEKAMADYGHIISKYKPELESRTVMIVKNLDKVSGEVAQAFHSMCDEYTPLVKKTVFFFTMKIENLNNLQDSNVNMAEETLRSNWSNLDEDIFEPLFTRISSIVLRIVPENM